MSASTMPATIAQTLQEARPGEHGDDDEGEARREARDCRQREALQGRGAEAEPLAEAGATHPRGNERVEAPRAGLRLEEPEEVVARADPGGKLRQLREAACLTAVLGRCGSGGGDRAGGRTADVREAIGPARARRARAGTPRRS